MSYLAREFVSKYKKNVSRQIMSKDDLVFVIVALNTNLITLFPLWFHICVSCIHFTKTHTPLIYAAGDDAEDTLSVLPLRQQLIRDRIPVRIQFYT